MTDPRTSKDRIALMIRQLEQGGIRQERSRLKFIEHLRAIEADITRPAHETIVGRYDAKLDELANLPRGWDSYDGIPPRGDCLAKARQLAALLPEGHWDIVPMSNGGLQIEQHCGGLDIELMIEGAGPAPKANERELSPSEATSFDKALARSPRRIAEPAAALQGKPCTCPDTSATACGVERGHKLGELWYCRRAAENGNPQA